MVYTGDLKSPALGIESSSLSSRTTKARRRYPYIVGGIGERPIGTAVVPHTLRE